MQEQEKQYKMTVENYKSQYVFLEQKHTQASNEIKNIYNQKQEVVTKEVEKVVYKENHELTGKFEAEIRTL